MEIRKYSHHDLSLNTLLELDGEIFPMDNGYWTKINAAKVNPTKHIPHGIKYSLTLHDRYNNRIIGFDNAHAYKAKIKRFSGRKITWDHKHKCEKIEPYEYESASQLLEDFWNEVYNI
jgi:hypothetical protein